MNEDGGLSRAPLVFATYGTDHHRFDRLSGWLERWLDLHPHVECVVQEGSSHPPRQAKCLGIVSRAELLEQMRRSSIVVGQGAPGTVRDAAQCGRLPVVVPRMPSHGEHVDDHQVAFSRRMEADGRAVVAASEDAFRAILDAAIADPSLLRREACAPPITQTVENVSALLRLVSDHRPGFVLMRRLRRQRRRGTD